MLTREENELLTRTGPGTPMGELFRRFWVPVLMANELPAPDCPPVRVRVMSEDLVAFRDSEGKIALLDAHCPHRRADLFFGRNEEAGVRCVYHGWKFDVTGACVDMPNEPAESNFKGKITTTAYPCREQGGIIWAYMGPKGLEPELPQIGWSLVPDSHRYISKRLEECSYAQAVEGGIDTSHSAFLHKNPERLKAIQPQKQPSANEPVPAYKDYRTHRPDTSKWSVQRTDYGLQIEARFDAEEDTYQWRVTPWLVPFYTIIPNAFATLRGHAWVPIDDEHCHAYSISWNSARPLTQREIQEIESWTGIHAEVIPGTFRTIANQDNDYLIDRGLQRSYSFTGIKGIGIQDAAVQESAGRIIDRTLERLGTTDTGIIAMRRVLMTAAKDLQQGIEPREPRNGAAYHVRSANMVLRRGVPVEDAVKEFMTSYL